MTEAISSDRPDSRRAHVALVTDPLHLPMTAPIPEPIERPYDALAREVLDLEHAQEELGALQARLAALELALKERDEAAALHHLELGAMEKDLAIKQAYIARLEFEQDLLVTETKQLRARAAELFEDLERAEQRIVALGALAHDLQSQASYRLAVKLTRLLERYAPLARVLRGLLRLVGSRPSSS